MEGKEQTKRFRGLRRVTQAQEGLRSPSYQVHNLYWIGNQTPCEVTVECEATDLIIPYHRDAFQDVVNGSPSSLYPGLRLNLWLNESKQDKMIISNFHIPKITNFPFYRFTVG